MLKLAEVIREGLKTKKAHPKKTIEDISSKKASQDKTITSLPDIKIEKEPILLPSALKATAEDKKKVGAARVGEEIEKAEINIDETACVYKIGDIASLDFKSMEKVSTVMATCKVEEAIKKALLKKCDITPEELEEEISKHDKKIKSLATRCYVHVLRQKMQ